MTIPLLATPGAFAHKSAHYRRPVVLAVLLPLLSRRHPLRADHRFLGALRRQIKQPLLIIWEGMATHRSRLVKAWLEEQDGQVAVARLPPYAPELNPVETTWAYFKKYEIANLCLGAIGAVGQFARNRLKSMQRRANLVAAFWKRAELAF